MSFTLDQLPRNAPTIINSVFQPTQFWDSRVNSLEDQADSVIMNPNEMHGTSFEIVTERITASEDYIKLFNKAFPETVKHGIARKHIKAPLHPMSGHWLVLIHGSTNTRSGGRFL